jgi:hypothetical protein
MDGAVCAAVIREGASEQRVEADGRLAGDAGLGHRRQRAHSRTGPQLNAALDGILLGKSVNS